MADILPMHGFLSIDDASMQIIEGLFTVAVGIIAYFGETLRSSLYWNLAHLE